MGLPSEAYAALAAHPIQAFAGGVLLYFVWTAFYRLFLHPLARIPGPKLAALTFYYEFYYDGIQEGKYTFKIEEMHNQYGPIIRINPEEVHINDSSFIDQVYAGGGSGKKRDKSKYFTRAFGKNAGFSTISHDLHRLRRNALNRYFSKSSVTRLESLIRERSSKLCDRIEEFAGTKKPVDMIKAMSCFATDMITEYCHGLSYNFLSEPEFENSISEAMKGGLQMAPILRRLPWLADVLGALPPKAVLAMAPGMHGFIRCKRDIHARVIELQQELAKDPEKQSAKGIVGSTVMQEILLGDLPEAEKESMRVSDEAAALIGAGTETVSWTLSVTLFHLLDQPDVLHKLREELLKVAKSPEEIPSWSTLEKVPYLSAVIAEGLRCANGVISRLARAPHEPLLYSHTNKNGKHLEYILKPGTNIGMSSYLIHRDPKIFPNADLFDPERWLDQNTGLRHHNLDSYLLAFSKGSRSCIGINLAYAELHVCLATLVLRLGNRIKLYETTFDDIRFEHDYMMAMPKRDSKGVRIIVDE